MPISNDPNKRKRQLNAIIIAAFNLTADDVLSLSSPIGEENDEAVFEKFKLNLPEINSARQGEALQRVHIWLNHRIADAMTIGKEPTLSRQEFKRLQDDVVIAAVERGLMNYAKALNPSADRMDAELTRNQIYVQQMVEIELPDAVQIHGAHCFLVAAINRDGWKDDESIDEDDVCAFEQSLLSGYKQKKSNVSIVHKDNSQIEQGVALFDACMDPVFCNNIRIGNRDALDMTVEGSFHMLANACEIGWHPAWSQKFKKQGVANGTVA